MFDRVCFRSDVRSLPDINPHSKVGTIWHIIVFLKNRSRIIHNKIIFCVSKYAQHKSCNGISETNFFLTLTTSVTSCKHKHNLQTAVIKGTDNVMVTQYMYIYHIHVHAHALLTLSIATASSAFILQPLSCSIKSIWDVHDKQAKPLISHHGLIRTSQTVPIKIMI